MAQSKPLPKFSILVCGTTGVGKSSLINYLLGEDVCEVGDPGEVDEDDADEAFDRKTVKVSKQEMIINGVSVTIFDSPGLQDGTADEPKYLADMLENCRDVDLVFYCHEMIATRWTPPEVYSVRLLTETFGNTFWDKAILVLTKANLVRPVKEVTKEEKKEYFRKMKVYKETKFRTEVAKQVNCTQEHPNGIDNIPAVPAGSEAVQFLLDGKHFIGNLWVTCLERLPSNQVELFMQATGSTSRIVSSDDVKGSVLPGFIPTREELVKAWEVMFRRRKQEMKDKQSVQAIVQEESQPESHPSLGVTTDDHFESRYGLPRTIAQLQRFLNLLLSKLRHRFT